MIAQQERATHTNIDMTVYIDVELLVMQLLVAVKPMQLQGELVVQYCCGIAQKSVLHLDSKPPASANHAVSDLSKAATSQYTAPPECLSKHKGLSIVLFRPFPAMSTQAL